MMANENAHQRYPKWLRAIVNWLKRVFDPDKPQPSSEILQTSYSPDRQSSLYLVTRPGGEEAIAKGAMRTWRLNNASGTGSIFLTLDLLPVARQYYRMRRIDTAKRRQKTPITAEEKGLYLEGYRSYEYRFSVFWSYVAPNGTIEFKPLAVIDFDASIQRSLTDYDRRKRAIQSRDAYIDTSFQSTSVAKVGEMAMRELRDLSASGKPWDERIQAIDYLDLLQSHTDSFYRVSTKRLKGADRLKVRHIERYQVSHSSAQPTPTISLTAG